MQKKLPILFTLIMLIFGSGNGVAQQTEEYYDAQSLIRLHDATQWLVEDGVQTYLDIGTRALKSRLIDRFKVNLWVTPIVDEHQILSDFRIKSRGINFDIRNMHRVEDNGVFYEFWNISIVPADWSPVAGDQFFFTPPSPNTSSSRTIIRESEDFVPAIISAAGKRYLLPINDMKFLYDLEAWHYPHKYAGTDVPLKPVVLTGDGRYIFGM